MKAWSSGGCVARLRAAREVTAVGSVAIGFQLRSLLRWCPCVRSHRVRRMRGRARSSVLIVTGKQKVRIMLSHVIALGSAVIAFLVSQWH